MKIVGERIFVDIGLSEDNFKQIFEWQQDLDTIKYKSWATERSKSVEELKNVFKTLDVVGFPVYTKDDNKFIGYLTIEREKKDSVFGIYIAREYWGHGFGYESSMVILNYFFNQLEGETMHLRVNSLHKAAVGLYKKIGFHIDKKVKNHRTCPVGPNHELRKCGSIFMSFSKKDFKKKINS